jgi:hypothetical protein
MIRKLKNGTVSYSRIEVRIFNPGNKDSKLHIIQAQPGHAYPEKQVDGIVENFAEKLEAAAPGEEYEIVDVGPARFNFVWRGRKPTPAEQQITYPAPADEEVEYVGDPELVAKAKATNAAT